MGSFLPGGHQAVKRAGAGRARPRAWVPALLRRQTDLDFLLVVVDLPGDVNMHSTPLPWFLQQEERRGQEEDLAETAAFSSPKLWADLGCRGFSQETRELCAPQVPLSAALRCPGPREPQSAPLSSHGSPSWRESSENHTTRPSPLPRTRRQKPEAHSVTLLPLFRCQLAGLGGREALQPTL